MSITPVRPSSFSGSGLRPNSFVMITANRVLHCNADTPEEMHHWITLLQRSKGDTRVDGQEFIIRGDGLLREEHRVGGADPIGVFSIVLVVVIRRDLLVPSCPSGWLHKEMRNSSKAALKLKKRWFLLTHNSLDYYKSSERGALKLGALVLNSLCSVAPPDERVFKDTGERRGRDFPSPPNDGLLSLSVTRSLSASPGRLLERDRLRPQALVPPLLQAAERGHALGHLHPERHRHQGARGHAHPAAGPRHQGRTRGGRITCVRLPVGCMNTACKRWMEILPCACGVHPSMHWARRSGVVDRRVSSAGELFELGGGGADLQEEPHPSPQPPPAALAAAAAALRRHPPEQ